MKIVFTVINDLSYDQRMHRISQTLSKEYDVLLVGRVLNSSLALEQQLYTQKRLRCIFNKGKLFYLEYNLRLFFYLLIIPFDIVCGVDMDTIAPAYLVSKFRKKACVYDAHEYFSEVPELENRPFTKKVWRYLESWIIPRIKYAYTVSSSIANVFKEKYGVNFKVIRNLPMSYELSVKQTKADKKRLIYQGALNKGRGLEYVIQAMKDLNCELWIIGEGDLSEQLRSQCDQLGLNNVVKFWGKQPINKLRELMSSCTIGLNLLEPIGKSYAYALNNKFFDYIHAEIPSVSPDFAEFKSINDQIQVADLISDPKNFDTLISVINNLLNNDKHYDKLVLNCKKAKSLYCWEEEAKELSRFYRSIS